MGSGVKPKVNCGPIMFHRNCKVVWPNSLILRLTKFNIELMRSSRTYIFIITARKRSLGQGNIFRSACQEFCPQGGGTLAGTPPGPGTPPWAGPPPQTMYTPPDQVHTPQDQVPPRVQCMLGDTGKRAVRILLECILVYFYLEKR